MNKQGIYSVFLAFDHGSRCTNMLVVQLLSLFFNFGEVFGMAWPNDCYAYSIVMSYTGINKPVSQSGLGSIPFFQFNSNSNSFRLNSNSNSNSFGMKNSNSNSNSNSFLSISIPIPFYQFLFNSFVKPN